MIEAAKLLRPARSATTGQMAYRMDADRQPAGTGTSLGPLSDVAFRPETLMLSRVTVSKESEIPPLNPYPWLRRFGSCVSKSAMFFPLERFGRQRSVTT